MPPIIPIIAGIALAGTGAAIAGAIGTTLIGLGVSAVLGGVSGLLQKKPKVNELRDKIAGRTVTARNVIAPRRIVIGQVRVGGVDTSFHVSGTDKEFLNEVVTLAGHELESIDNLYLNGELVPLTPSGAGFVATGKFAGHLYMEKRLGTPDQTAFTQYQTERPGGWTTDHKQLGNAAVYLRYKFNPDLFPNGRPNPTFDVKGLKVPDPRNTAAISSISRTSNVVTVNTTIAHLLVVGKQAEIVGVTAAGFDGWFRVTTVPNSTSFTYDQTGANESSSGGAARRFLWTRNPALIWRWLRLWKEFGYGQDLEEMDDDLVVAAANICEEQIALLAGGTEDRYLCDGTWESSEQLGQIELQILGSMAGARVYSGGMFRVYAGAFLPPEEDFDESDLWGPVSVETRIARRDTFNAVKGLFVSPDNNWQPSDFPPITSPTYEAEDGGVRIWRDIELPFTTSATMAMRLAKIDLERARRQLSVSADFHLRAFAVQPVETIRLSLDRFSWSLKQFQIVDMEPVKAQEGGEDAPAFLCTLFLRETDSSIYSWSSSEEGGVTVPGTPDITDPLGSPSPGSHVLILVENPGFENGDRSWNKGTGWSIVNDQTNAYDGQWAAKWVGPTAGVLQNPVFIPIQPGDVISASAMGIRTVGATSKVRARISWRDAAKIQLATGGTSPGTEVFGSAYALSHVADAAPAGAFFAVIEAEIVSPAASNTIFVDSFRADIFAMQWGSRNPIENSGVMIFTPNANVGIPRVGVWSAISTAVTSHAAAAPSPVPTGRSFQAVFTNEPPAFLLGSPKIPKTMLQVGKPYVASFFARVLSGTQNLRIDLRSNLIAGGSFDYANKLVTLATSWRRFFIVFISPKTNDDTEDTGVRIGLRRLSADGNITATIQMTGAMIEEGHVLHAYDTDAISRSALFEDAMLPSSFENLSRSFEFTSASFYQVSGGASIETASKRAKLLASSPPTAAIVKQRLTNDGTQTGTSRFASGDDVTVLIYPFYLTGAKPTADLFFRVLDTASAILSEIKIVPDDVSTSRTGSPFIAYSSSLTGSSPWNWDCRTVEGTNAWYIAAFVYYRGRGLGKPLPSAEDVGITTPSSGSTGGTTGSGTFSGGAGGSTPPGGGGFDIF